eukprot:931271-Rhodomonas_salina.1
MSSGSASSLNLAQRFASSRLCAAATRSWRACSGPAPCHGTPSGPTRSPPTRAPAGCFADLNREPPTPRRDARAAAVGPCSRARPSGGCRRGADGGRA